MAESDTPKLLVAGLLFTIAAAGCTQTVRVYKPGAPPDQVKRDAYECERDRAVYGSGQLAWWVMCMEARGYSRNPQSATSALPLSRLTTARKSLNQALLRKIESGGCPSLQPCLGDYERDLRGAVLESGFTFSSRDELLLRMAKDIARRSDEGELTQAQAVNQLLVLDAQIDEIIRTRGTKP